MPTKLITPTEGSSIDTNNLEKALDKLKSKYGELNKFKILLLGILIGAIISAPIQLLILPFSYEETIIKYNDKILSENMPTEIYIFMVFFAIIFSILIITILYKTILVGLNPQESVPMKYKGNYEKLYQELKKFLKEECNYLDVKMKALDNKIVCYRGEWERPYDGFGRAREGKILTIIFRPDLTILNIMFKPEDVDSMRLINKIRGRYG